MRSCNLFRPVVVIHPALLWLIPRSSWARIHAPRIDKDPVKVVAHNRGFADMATIFLSFFSSAGRTLFPWPLCSALCPQCGPSSSATFVLAVFAITEPRSECFPCCFVQIHTSRCVFSIVEFDAGLDLFSETCKTTFRLQSDHRLSPSRRYTRQGLNRSCFSRLDPEHASATRSARRARLGRFGHSSRQRLLGDVFFLTLGIPLELFADGFQQRLICWFLSPGLPSDIRLSLSKKLSFSKIFVMRNPRAVPSTSHFNSARRQFQQLQAPFAQHSRRCKNAPSVNRGHLTPGVDLAGQQDLLVIAMILRGRAGCLSRPNKKKRSIMWGNYHNIAQGQHR